MGINKRGPLDAPNVRTGKDGALFMNNPSKGGNILLSEVNQFRLTASFQNTDWQPVSSSLIFGIPTGHTLSLSLTETQIRDDLIMAEIWQTFEDSGVRADSRTFEFQTLLEGRNGRDQRIRIPGCIPDGDVDLLAIVPGEIVSHEWKFRCNENPILLSQLGIDY